MKNFIYMRFSIVPFHVIVEYLNLTSSAFVIPIFRTALLTILNETSHRVVNCYEVERYIDMFITDYYSSISVL